MGGNIWLPAITAAWGLTTATTAATRNFGGFVAVRFFLGFCEGGLLGGISLYLSQLYPRFSIQQRIARFYAAAAIAGSFGGLLATGLTRLTTNGIVGWRWLYIVEGVITIGFGIFAICIMPNSVATTRYLSEQERKVMLAALAADASTSRRSAGPATGHEVKIHHDHEMPERVDQEDFEWREVRRGIFEIQTWLTGLGYLALCCSLYSITLFLPSILQGVFPGSEQARIQLLTVPPFVPAAILVLIVAWAADKTKMRGPYILGFMRMSPLPCL